MVRIAIASDKPADRGVEFVPVTWSKSEGLSFFAPQMHSLSAVPMIIANSRESETDCHRAENRDTAIYSELFSGNYILDLAAGMVEKGFSKEIRHEHRSHQSHFPR